MLPECPERPIRHLLLTVARQDAGNSLNAERDQINQAPSRANTGEMLCGIPVVGRRLRVHTDFPLKRRDFVRRPVRVDLGVSSMRALAPQTLCLCLCPRRQGHRGGGQVVINRLLLRAS